MCLQSSPVRPYQKWDWNGNEIVHDTAIPAARSLMKKGKKVNRFAVDIREFLTIENNAVISNMVNNLVDKLPENDKIRFYQNKPGNFDFRVRKCQEFMNNISYSNAESSYEQWQFPEETWELKSGDCEDVAFLLASLLASCKISDYCIRVALGRVVNHSAGHLQKWEHAWVMYHNENGVWEIIEPLLFVQHAPVSHKQSSTKNAAMQTIENYDIEYLPFYVFNRSHLWRVRTYDPMVRDGFLSYITSDREYFNKFNPGFAMSVHHTIYHAALKGISWMDLQRVILTSLYIDVNTVAYDPRDHFDFAYIDESWQRVEERLATGTLTDFALAIHAIGDFYAHSLYGYFMLKNGKLPVYDPAHPLPPEMLNYDFSGLGDIKGCDPKKWNKKISRAEDLWKGKLVSGQWWRVYVSIPDELRDKKDFALRRCLPDHDGLAVDADHYDPQKHKLFKTKEEYDIQFNARVSTTIEHIRKVYLQWDKNRIQ